MLIFISTLYYVDMASKCHEKKSTKSDEGSNNKTIRKRDEEKF